MQAVGALHYGLHSLHSSTGHSHVLITFPAQLIMMNALDGELIRVCV